MAIEGINFEQSLYVACALNGSPDEYRAEIDDIRDTLEHEHGVNVLRFRGLGDFLPLDVYQYDIGLVANCSAFLAIYGHLSDGRGMETERAFSRGIPMLGIARKDAAVSKMITGGYEHHGQPFVWVDDLRSEVPKLAIRQFVEIHTVL